VYLGIALAGLGVWLAAQAAARLHAPDAPSHPAVFSLPFGAALCAALPPAWDYASAGLEVGVGLAWLGVAFRASARAATGGYDDASGRRRLLVDALLVGVAPLVRPDLALHAFVPLALLTAAACARAGSGPPPSRPSTPVWPWWYERLVGTGWAARAMREARARTRCPRSRPRS
jgi:arabinofuranosyltransferase